MRSWTVLIAVLVLGALSAALALETPRPRPANAPAAVFSADRAIADIAVIAQRPHPTGSPDAARVRQYLTRRLDGLGLAPTQTTRIAPDGTSVTNILGVLPGTDRSAPALMLMSHSDSVPAGPGAADDGAGVASALEIVRALKAAGPHRRDVMVLFTDSEEHDLSGARVFFGGDPAASHVGVILNLEARGDRGRVVMFETHRQAASMIGLLNRSGALSGASSLMPDLYRRLPNTTDLTIALAHGAQPHGVMGLNFALFDGFAAYHQPTDDLAHLDPGSVQHMGDQALAAAKVLADAPALPGRAPDQVYADVLGGPVLQYPPAVGWAVLALAALGVAFAAAQTVRVNQASAAGLAGGAAGLLALVLMLGAALDIGGMVRRATAGAPHALLHHESLAMAACALLAAGAAILWLGASRQLLRPLSAWLGALALAWLLAAALQAAAPLDAFILAWPVLLISLGAAAAAVRPQAAPIVAPFALAALAQILYWTGQMFALVGQQAPLVLTPFAALAVLVLAPLAPRAIPPRAGAAFALVLILAGAALAALSVQA